MSLAETFYIQSDSKVFTIFVESQSFFVHVYLDTNHIIISIGLSCVLQESVRVPFGVSAGELQSYNFCPVVERYPQPLLPLPT